MNVVEEDNNLNNNEEVLYEVEISKLCTHKLPRYQGDFPINKPRLTENMQIYTFHWWNWKFMNSAENKKILQVCKIWLSEPFG